MTEEEIKQKAEEYALEKCKECYMCNSEENGERLYCAKFESRKEGYIAGAEPREKEIKSLGERCLQLQKDKGNLTDRVNNLEEKLANADYQLEGRDLEIKELKEQIEKMKQDLDSARENANRQEQWEIYSVLNGIYNDNFEVITGVSN